MSLENEQFKPKSNIADFEAAKSRIRAAKPAKPGYSGITEYFSFEKAAETKQLTEQAEGVKEQVAKLEKIAAELEQDYLIALAKKNQKTRVEKSKTIFESLTRVNSEIIRLKGLLIDVQDHFIREEEDKAKN